MFDSRDFSFCKICSGNMLVGYQGQQNNEKNGCCEQPNLSVFSNSFLPEMDKTGKRVKNNKKKRIFGFSDVRFSRFFFLQIIFEKYVGEISRNK